MLAAVITRFGDPGVLELAELREPVPVPGEVAIDVTHAAVGLIDASTRTSARGLPTSWRRTPRSITEAPAAR